MEQVLDTIWLIDSIVAIILKVIAIIAISVWIIIKKVTKEVNNEW
tara:strand:- start:316 stop:450 length:135 start_codon:yes stop_codon:yes gene_type:complete